MSDTPPKFIVPDDVSDAVTLSGADEAQWYGGPLNAENGHEVEFQKLKPVKVRKAIERPIRSSADLLDGR